MRRLLATFLLAVPLLLVRAQQPSAGEQDRLFGEIGEIFAQLSEITGWKAPKKVDPAVISKDGVKQFLESRIQEVVDPEDLRAEELALKKLGLAPQSFDLKKTTVDLLTEQAAAFYDYRKKKLFILDANASLAQKPVLVHELAHALADAHVNLEKYIFKGKSDDAALARQAVMEGQATWLMSEYLMARMGTSLRKNPEMAEMMSRMNGAAAGMYPVFDAAPLYIRESLLFPYTKGFLFQQAVVLKLGVQAFAAVYAKPPLSTQQIIHPELYMNNVEPAKPRLPKANLKGYETLIEGTLGEFDHEVLFKQYGGEAASKHAANWRGGQFRVLEHKKDKRLILLYASQWADERSAREAFRLYRQVLDGKWEKFEIQTESETRLQGVGDDGAFVLTLEGVQLTSVEGLPSGPLAAHRVGAAAAAGAR